MTLEEFKLSVSKQNPPAELNDLLKSLWYDAKGNWNKAHSIAQNISTKEGALLHAYLHRIEGDEWNAEYWYNRASETKFKGSVEDEWSNLVRRFL